MEIRVRRAAARRASVAGDLRGQLEDARAEAAEQVLDPRRVQAGLGGEALGPVAQRPEPFGADQRRLVGDRGWHPLLQRARRGVDRVLRHHPVGRVLAARDRHQPWHRHRDGVLAAELRGALRLVREQGPLSSVQTPVQLITCRARTLISSPVWASRATTPVTRSPSRRKPTTATLLATWAP
jgi:hypothetical protein